MRNNPSDFGTEDHVVDKFQQPWFGIRIRITTQPGCLENKKIYSHISIIRVNTSCNVYIISGTQQIQKMNFSIGTETDVSKLKTEDVLGAAIICLVALGGLAMNLTGVFTILKMPRKVKLFNNLIICLLLFDSLFLISAPFFFFGLHHEKFGCTLCAWLVPYWAVPCGHMSLFGTIMMTLAISHERYLAVKNPLEHNSNVQGDDAFQMRRLAIYLIPTLFLAISLNIPRFLDFEIKINSTSESLTICLTEQACNCYYINLYENILCNFFFGLLPFFSMVFLGHRTFREFKDHNMYLTTLLGSSPLYVEQKKTEEQLLKVMKVLVITFLLCHTPRMTLYCFNAVFATINGTRYDCQEEEPRHGCKYPMVGKYPWYGLYNNFSIFMVMVNSSIGSLLYCASNKPFKTTMLDNFKSSSRVEEWNTWRPFSSYIKDTY